MNVLARARRAASEIRDRLDLEAVRDLVHDPTVPAEGCLPTPEDRRVVAIARTLGAPDPYALMDASEAAAAVGSPVGPPRLTYGDDTVGVVRAGGAPDAGIGAVSVSAFFPADEDGVPFDADAHWHECLAPVLEGDAVAVAGVGRAALRTTGGLYVLGVSNVLYLTLTRPDGTTGDEQLGGLARAVLRRLEGRAADGEPTGR